MNSQKKCTKPWFIDGMPGMVPESVSDDLISFRKRCVGDRIPKLSATDFISNIVWGTTLVWRILSVILNSVVRFRNRRSVYLCSVHAFHAKTYLKKRTPTEPDTSNFQSASHSQCVKTRTLCDYSGPVTCSCRMNSLPPKIRVLHVDDEPSLAELTATFLHREDDRFAVESATNVTEGLETFAAGEFHCIVSDYDMPGQTGIDFLTTLRETHPRIPFILYTGKGSEDVASEAISAGVTDYLQKEIGTSQYAILANRIKNVVASYNAQESTREAEQRFSELAENSDDILFSFTADWRELLFINSSFEDFWGVPAEVLEENPKVFLDQIHENDREKARESMHKLSNGEPDEIEYRVIHPERGLRWVRGQSKPIFDDDGAVVRIVGSVQEIAH